MWVKHMKHWGCLWDSWGNLQARHPLACGQASWWGSSMDLVVSTSPWHVSIRALAAVLPATHCSPVMQLTTQYSGLCEKEKGFFGRVLHQETRHSHFSLSEKSWAKKVSLRTKLCHLGEGVMWVKWPCSSYLLQCIQSQTVFAPMVCCNISTGLPQRPSPMWVIVKLHVLCGEDGRKWFNHVDDVATLYIFYILIVVRATWVYKPVKLINIYT